MPSLPETFGALKRSPHGSPARALRSASSGHAARCTDPSCHHDQASSVAKGRNGASSRTATDRPRRNAATADAAGPGPCVSSDLQASLGQSGGAAGTFYHLVVLTNTSDSACTLYGYPGVSFVTGQGGSIIGAPAVRNPLLPDTLVTLPSGGAASALLGVTDTGVLTPSACRPGTADWLQIYPPGDLGAVFVQLSSGVCTRPGERYMTVTAVHAGKIDSF